MAGVVEMAILADHHWGSTGNRPGCHPDKEYLNISCEIHTESGLSRRHHSTGPSMASRRSPLSYPGLRKEIRGTSCALGQFDRFDGRQRISRIQSSYLSRLDHRRSGAGHLRGRDLLERIPKHQSI